MFYLISPLTWPFTIIPNLPQNLIEVIDSPIPLLAGMLGNRQLAEKIYKMRGGKDNIIIIENGKFNYYKEEKLKFDLKPFDKLYKSIRKNYVELNFDSCRINLEQYRLVCQKIYKNLYGSIQSELCSKIEAIADKYIKIKFKDKNSNGFLKSSNQSLKSEELEMRHKITDEFSKLYSDDNKISFIKIFSQTQIFATYLDTYLEKNK